MRLFITLLLMVMPLIMPSTSSATERILIRVPHYTQIYDARTIGAKIEEKIRAAFMLKFPKYGFEAQTSLKLTNQLSMDAFVMSLLGDRAPDIISIPFRNSVSFIDQGFMLPLDTFYAEWEKESTHKNLIPPVAEPVIKQNGHVYFVSAPPTFTALYYRKDLFEQAGLTRPPANWDELYTWAQKLTNHEKGIWGYGIYGHTNNPISWHWLNFIKQAGGELFSQNAQGHWETAFNDKHGIAALKFYHKLIRGRWTRNGQEHRGVSKIIHNTLWDELKEGTIAMAIMNGNHHILFDINLGMDASQLTMAPLPAGPTGIYAGMTNATLRGINSSLKDPARIRAAWEYLKFRQSEEAEYITINHLVEQGYAQYTNPQLLKKYGFERYIANIPKEWLQTYKIMSAHSFPEPYLRGTNNIYPVIDPALHEICIRDSVNYQKELDEVAARINTKLLGYVPEKTMRWRKLITYSIFLTAVILISLLAFLYIRKHKALLKRLPQQAKIKHFLMTGSLSRTALFMMLPALLTIIMWQYVPLFYSFYIALTDYTINAGSTFIGLNNFIDALWQPDFWIGVKNTFLYVGLTVFMGFLGPILLALLLNEIPVGSMLLRFIYFLPAAVSPLVVSLLWVNFYAPTPEGLFNQISLFFGFAPQEWLQNPRMAMICIILPGIWQNLGIGSVFYLAALKNIPEDLYEVADLDGADIFLKTWHVTLMSIKPLILIQLIGTIIAAFHATQRILVMTQGGPAKATHTLGLEIFYGAFQYMRFGYATAVAWIMGSFIVGFTFMQLNYVRKNRQHRVSIGK